MKDGYALGFAATAEGWNGEYPGGEFRSDPDWLAQRDVAVERAAAIMEGKGDE